MSTRLKITLTSMALLLAAASPALGEIKTQCPGGVGVKCLHLAAGDGFVKMADGLDLYMFGFANVTGMHDHMVMHEGMLGANFPAPTLAFAEGDEVYLTLTNVGMMMRPDLFDPHTVHFHGFPNASAVFDGVPDAAISINMGSSLTYYYRILDPGTYLYHCHVEATEHMEMGMLGQLFVTPAQDGTTLEYPPGSGRTYERFVFNDGDGSTGYDAAFPLQFAGFDHRFHIQSETVQPLDFANIADTYPMINGRGYPDTVVEGPILNIDGRPSQPVSALVTATQGQRVLLRMSNLSVARYYTITVNGIPMHMVGHGARALRGPDGSVLPQQVGSVTLGGGESADVILDTTEIEPGVYFLYATNLDALSNNDEDFGGMMTEIHVNP